VTSTPPRIVIVRVVSASPEEVFDAWTDPESLAIWMCPGSVQGSVVDVDARVGGRFRIVMKGTDCDHEHTGEYLALERPHKLVFTWISTETRGRATTVSVTIRAQGAGRSELTLIHEGLPDETAVDKHRHGWGDILEKLGRHLSEGRGQE
jgi:uncharacterized protein YndB with AHSA1/START domain